MKRKLRIFSHIAIICLSVCMFAFGVYAANQVSVTTSGTVSFVAEGVYATVTRSISGSTEDATHNTIDPVKITADVQDTDEPFAMDANLQFKNAQTPIIISFKIKNEAPSAEEGRDIFVKVDKGEKLTQTSNDNVTKIVDNLGMYFSIAPQTEVTVDILLMVADANKSASAYYDYTISLQNSIEGYYALQSEDYVQTGSSDFALTDEVKAKSKIIIPSNFFEDNMIPYGLFQDNTTLTNIVLPNTITAIGDSAFKNCTNLIEFAIPTSVVNFGDEYSFEGTFAGCTSLTALYLPTELKTVGAGCFDGLTGLETLVIKSKSITILSGNFFGKNSTDSKLTEITLINPEKFEFIGYFDNSNTFERLNIIKPELTTLQDAWNLIYNGYNPDVYDTGTGTSWGLSQCAKKIYYNNTLIEDILFPENFTLGEHHFGQTGVTTTHYKTVYMNSTFAFATEDGEQTSFGCLQDVDFYIDSQNVYDATKIDSIYYLSCGEIFNSKGTINILKSIIDADTNKESILFDTTSFAMSESTVTYNGQQYYSFKRIYQ